MEEAEEEELKQEVETETANAVFFQVPLRAADRGGRVGAKGRNRDCECSFCSHPNPGSLEVAIEMCSLNNRYMCMSKILGYKKSTEYNS